MMTYAQASAIADSMNAQDTGVLIYRVARRFHSILSNDDCIIVCVCAKTGAVLGEV